MSIMHFDCWWSATDYGAFMVPKNAFFLTLHAWSAHNKYGNNNFFIHLLKYIVIGIMTCFYLTMTSFRLNQVL